MKLFASIIASALCLVLFTQCVPNPVAPQRDTPYLHGFNHQHTGEMGYWDGDGVTGSPKIVINLGQQRAYFYKGRHLVGQTPISTGNEAHNTPRGRFKVTQKNIDHKSSLYGVIRDNATGQIVNPDADTRKHKAGPGQTFERAPMEYFLRFNGAIGMHKGYLPGYPASHGCVRLPGNMAKMFFENADYGTPVIVE